MKPNQLCIYLSCEFKILEVMPDTTVIIQSQSKALGRDPIRVLAKHLRVKGI